ncbi:hypothetical protein [Photorhabdus sp. RM71S]|uniref:hypothetical protein n=1 Tax=Photorhabdus sp. RM71S TaxID=3342824 RepID=UPI0036DEDBB0
MFKKLLTVGALVTVLIGGIGTVSAAPCNSQEPEYVVNGIYFRYVVNPDDNLPISFSENTKFGWMTWNLYYLVGPCELHTGGNAFQALYEGRLN